MIFASLFEIIGVVYVLALAWRMCVTIGHAIEHMRDVRDEDLEAWNALGWTEKLQIYVECVIGLWFLLPVMWVTKHIKKDL
jgi:hypothetical protein